MKTIIISDKMKADKKDYISLVIDTIEEYDGVSIATIIKAKNGDVILLCNNSNYIDKQDMATTLNNDAICDMIAINHQKIMDKKEEVEEELDID